MSRYWKTAEYSQLSAEELRYKAEESMRKAESKGRSMEPVTIEGRAITVSWWGKAWCENLEKYADFASRLERGKRYVRTGTVIDLQIRAGRIQARGSGTAEGTVQGGNSHITIKGRRLPAHNAGLCQSD